jgi:hypothetical protein
MIAGSSSIIEQPSRDELIDALLRRPRLTPISSIEASDMLDEWADFLDFKRNEQGRWVAYLISRKRKQ